MTRNINSLKENECIHIRTKKEAKGIAKLCKHIINPTLHSNGFDDIIKAFKTNKSKTIIFTNNGKFISFGNFNLNYVRRQNILPASDFLPSKKDNLRKKVLKAFPEFINLIEVKTELNELPEKWCLKCKTEQDAIYFMEWVVKNKQTNFTYKISELQDTFFHYPIFDGMHTIDHIKKGYTEISTEDFKRLVLKEEVKPELEV